MDKLAIESFLKKPYPGSSTFSVEMVLPRAMEIPKGKGSRLTARRVLLCRPYRCRMSI